MPFGSINKAMSMLHFVHVCTTVYFKIIFKAGTMYMQQNKTRNKSAKCIRSLKTKIYELSAK